MKQSMPIFGLVDMFQELQTESFHFGLHLNIVSQFNLKLISFNLLTNLYFCDIQAAHTDRPVQTVMYKTKFSDVAHKGRNKII
jgi:hypothetical protein